MIIDYDALKPFAQKPAISTFSGPRIQELGTLGVMRKVAVLAHWHGGTLAKLAPAVKSQRAIESMLSSAKPFMLRDLGVKNAIGFKHQGVMEAARAKPLGLAKTLSAFDSKSSTAFGSILAQQAGADRFAATVLGKLALHPSVTAAQRRQMDLVQSIITNVPRNVSDVATVVPDVLETDTPDLSFAEIKSLDLEQIRENLRGLPWVGQVSVATGIALVYGALELLTMDGDEVVVRVA